MAFKELPEKYYLDHFNEFLSFQESQCAHLLEPQEHQFIEQFRKLNEDAQCVLVRAANRKSPFMTKDSLVYQEIKAPYEQIDILIAHELLTPLTDADSQPLWEHLTKPELLECLQLSNIACRKSAPKAELVSLARQQIQWSLVEQSEAIDDRVKRNFDYELDYLLFLFFGNLSSRLNKFSLRDLGVMRTRKSAGTPHARFEELVEAKTAYFYSQHSRHVENLTATDWQSLASSIDEMPVPVGPEARQRRSRFLFKLGKCLLPINQTLAMTSFEHSDEPEATEKWLREAYKAGNKDEVQTRLNNIIEEPESEYILSFAEDFLARKYNKKRTSELTDMLREDSAPIAVDELFRDSVEQGVAGVYKRQGKQAYHTENYLFTSLFAIVFWEPLFSDGALANEFDYRPTALRHNNLYKVMPEQVEACLGKLDSTANAILAVSKTVTERYGQSNGLFNWHNSTLEILTLLLKHCPIESITAHLRAMAKNYRQFKDGYPDLMVVEDGKLWFEEIKAPGDQLRRNQLLTIRQLRKVGFDVHITKVEWQLDPQQPYAVVDIETTGGHGQHHRITEIGIVKIVNGEEVDRWQSLINPQRHIPRSITQLTGIDDEMVADAPLFCEIADKLESFF